MIFMSIIMVNDKYLDDWSAYLPTSRQHSLNREAKLIGYLGMILHRHTSWITSDWESQESFKMNAINLFFSIVKSVNLKANAWELAALLFKAELTMSSLEWYWSPQESELAFPKMSTYCFKKKWRSLLSRPFPPFRHHANVLRLEVSSASFSPATSPLPLSLSLFFTSVSVSLSTPRLLHSDDEALLDLPVNNACFWFPLRLHFFSCVLPLPQHSLASSSLCLSCRGGFLMSWCVPISVH